MTCAFGRREGRRSCVCPRAARAAGVPLSYVWVCSRPPRGRARFRRPRGWPAGPTGRGAAVAGRGRARHGRRRRHQRAPRRRTTTAADSSLSCQLTAAAVPPATRGPSRGPASCDLPRYSGHGYFTLTRVAAQLFANLGSKRRRGASLPRRAPQRTRRRSVDASESARRGGLDFERAFKH